MARWRFELSSSGCKCEFIKKKLVERTQSDEFIAEKRAGTVDDVVLIVALGARH